jgi:hypothetical protein
MTTGSHKPADLLDDLLDDIAGPSLGFEHVTFPLPDREDPPPLLWKTTEAAARLTVDRQVLDTLAAMYPDEPGGPLVVGGTTRIHRRWNPQTLIDWFTRVTARRARADQPRPNERPSRTRQPPAPTAPSPPTDFASSRKRLIGLGQKKKT